MGGRPGGQLEGWGLASSPPELLLVDSPTSSSPPANRLLAARCLSQARPHLSPRPSSSSSSSGLLPSASTSFFPFWEVISCQREFNCKDVPCASNQWQLFDQRGCKCAQNLREYFQVVPMNQIPKDTRKFASIPV